MGNIKQLRNEELVTLLSFAEERQAFLMNEDPALAETARQNDQAIAEEMVRRGINADTLQKYPRGTA